MITVIELPLHYKVDFSAIIAKTGHFDRLYNI